MAEFVYKGFVISVRRSKSGGGWHATATLQRAPAPREIAFAADADRIGDLVNKIEKSIHDHRSRFRDLLPPTEPGPSSVPSPVPADRPG